MIDVCAGLGVASVCVVAVSLASTDPARADRQTYFKASNTAAGDQFGWSTAISGDTLVIGARYEDSGSRVVNKGQDDDALNKAGAAYVFVHGEDGWTQQAYLKASNAGKKDLFGTAVAISGDTIVVGARKEAGSAGGIDGDGADDGLPGSGAAYVFVRDGEAWTQQASLKASHPGAEDLFGASVAIAGDTIIVGANAEDSAATGVDGDAADDSAPDAGAVYVYVRDGTTWTQQAYLKASNATAGDEFGFSLGVSGDTIVVGARREDGAGRGVDADQDRRGAFRAGSAYIFVRTGSTWTQQAYLKASNADAGDLFGISAGISGDTVVVGAYREGSRVDSDETDNSAFDTGAAYVFVREGEMWSQQAMLKASNGEPGDQFARSVALSGERVLVGARREPSRALALAGDPRDNSAPDAGAAYLFVRRGTAWTQQVYIKATNTSTGDFFGGNVSLDGTRALVGAPFEDGGARGVNGPSRDDGTFNAGAAYLTEVGRR